MEQVNPVKDAPHRVTVFRVRAVTFATPRSLSPRHFHSAVNGFLDLIGRMNGSETVSLLLTAKLIHARAQVRFQIFITISIFSYPAIRQTVSIDPNILFVRKYPQ